MLKVTCAIIEHENRVLITQRSITMPEPLLWEFPGGKIEQNETEENCLVREIKEELNLDVVPLHRLTPVVHHTPLRVIKLIPYICTLKGGEIRLLEHSAFEWAEISNLRSFNWCMPDLPVVEEYLQRKLHSS